MSSFKNTSQRKIFFDGDSIFATSQGGLRTNESILACYNGLTGTRPAASFNAISAKTIADLITDFPSKIGQWSKPNDIVVMNASTNSLAAQQNPATTFADVVTYVNLVKSYGLKIVYGTMTARSVAYGNMEADRLTLNTSIRGLATLDGVADPGADSHFDSVADTSNSTNYTDGLHMTSAGAVIYGQTYISPVQALL